MANIIAVLNQKGGVGKTTTAINIAAYLAKAGRRVLIVDADPQGNATSGLGQDKNALKRSIYDILLARADASSAIKKTSHKNLYLLGSNAQLAGAEVELVELPGREFYLKHVLEPLNYDYIIIDCPPSLGLLTVNALAAATDALVPVQAEYYALEGLSQLLATIQQVQAGLNPELRLLVVALTLYDSRNSLSEQVRAELEKHFGQKLLQTVIPRNVRLAEAPSFGKTIVEYDKWSKGARAYKALAKEIEEKIYG